MATLTPAPDALGLSSPALGPWFRDDANPTPFLAAPAADLSVVLSLPANMEWRAPAGGTAAYAVATTPRPAVLATLRQADGSLAFDNDGGVNLVVLFTLLPEVELRLAALTGIIPGPDGQNAPAGAAGRAATRHLALEIPAAAVADIDAVEKLRATDLPAELTSDADRAAYLGLEFEAGALGNAVRPVAELHRPNEDDAVILKNRSGAALACTLWAFDDRGRAIDPGAVANWWAYLASGTSAVTDPAFDNLWAHDDAADQRTASVAGSNTVLFCTPHEGPLPGAQLTRLVTNGLTAAAAGSALFTVGASPSAQITAGGNPNTDTMPIPRFAVLPNGPYRATGAPGTAPFAGWTSGTVPAAITRDFARIAVADIESHIVGVDRSNITQGDPALRVLALRNTAANPVLATTDAATAQVTATLNAGAAAVAMAPVMDTHWGALTPGASFGTGTPPGTIVFTVHALGGEGQADGDTAANQRVVVRFPASTLPAGAWVRVWTHGLDTATGLRYRQDGGAALVDVTGRAFVVTTLPDGTAAPDDVVEAPVRMSFDALVVAGTTGRYYLENRFDRPALVDGERAALGSIPAGATAWVCEQGAPLSAGVLQLGSGQTALVVPADEASGAYLLVDTAVGTLANTDVAAGTLRNSVGAGDQLIVTVPAFEDTPEGDVIDASGPVGANGATVLRRTRNGLVDDATQFGRPVPTMERRELAAIDPAGATGMVGATPGRASNHEAVPAQLAHAGVPAAAEIHGTGVQIAGPLAGALAMPMRERAASDLGDFVSRAQVPVNLPADPGGTSTFGAVLETLTHGVSGDLAVRTYLAAAEAAGGFQPGQGWVNLESAIQSATGIDLEALIDSGSFDSSTLAAAIDRVILKTRDGAAQAAAALQAAIARAEDYIYVETPAIDALAAGSGGGAIDLIGALTTRLAQRPGLVVLLCVPQKFLPGTPKKLDLVRAAGVGAALKALLDAAPGNVVLFTPTAGLGRALHMASTTVIVDDALLVAGSTHLWRRGLTFDSSLAVALFDEAVARARPAALRTARRQLIGDRLAIVPQLVPDDPRHLLESIVRLNESGGLMRVAANVYVAQPDPMLPVDQQAWNPDGRPGGTSNWYQYFVELGLDVLEEIDSAAR